MTKAAALALLLGAVLTACQDLNVPDLNNPAIEDLERNPTRTRVIVATQGLFIGARANIAAFNGHISILGVLGRESYNFDPGDPRFVTELLGGPLDGGSPRFGGNLWNERFANVRNANIILNALDVLGTTPPVQLAGLLQFPPDALAQKIVPAGGTTSNAAPVALDTPDAVAANV